MLGMFHEITFVTFEYLAIPPSWLLWVTMLNDINDSNSIFNSLMDQSISPIRLCVVFQTFIILKFRLQIDQDRNMISIVWMDWSLRSPILIYDGVFTYMILKLQILIALILILIASINFDFSIPNFIIFNIMRRIVSTIDILYSTKNN